MDVKQTIESLRNIMQTLQQWEELTQEKRLDAIYGHSVGMENTKVQTTKKIDRMESAIIKTMNLEAEKEKLIEKYWSDKATIERLLEEYCNLNDLTMLHRYMIGWNACDIPGTEKTKKPLTAIDRAIKKLQEKVDKAEALERQPQHIRELIAGKKRKCSKCNDGHIHFTGEDKEKYMFLCSGCGRKIKVLKGA